jgi:hypothetical protein
MKGTTLGSWASGRLKGVKGSWTMGWRIGVRIQLLLKIIF